MKTKRIIFGVILIIFVILIIVIINVANKSTTLLSNDNTLANRLTTNSKASTNTDNSSKDKLVLQDNLFITQLNDIYMNVDEYIGREIEVEGFPMSFQNYKFVGRYGPGCCSGDGYAYIEYEYDKSLKLTDEKEWIKVIGTIEQGKDGEKEYTYIKATSVEKMSERGQDTVTN